MPVTTTTDYHGLSSMLRKILQLTQTAKQNVPYAYRIAVPWLVHALPFRQVVSWQLQALVLIAASAGA